MIHNLMRDYNRRYYKNITKIWLRAHWKLLRLYIAGYIIKFAFLISSDAKDAIESRMRSNDYDT